MKHADFTNVRLGKKCDFLLPEDEEVRPYEETYCAKIEWIKTKNNRDTTTKNPKFHPCSYCGLIKEYPSDLRQHWKEMHLRPKTGAKLSKHIGGLYCKVCQNGKVFSHSRSLKKHLVKCHEPWELVVAGYEVWNLYGSGTEWAGVTDSERKIGECMQILRKLGFLEFDGELQEIKSEDVVKKE